MRFERVVPESWPYRTTQNHFRLEDVSGEPYSAKEMANLVNFIELFCYLIREKGGIDQIRLSLQGFEMREDGTIQREWLEGSFKN